jgi:hypothetical protein
MRRGEICRSFSRAPPRRRLTRWAGPPAKGVPSRTELLSGQINWFRSSTAEMVVQERELVSNVAIEVIRPARASAGARPMTAHYFPTHPNGSTPRGRWMVGPTSVSSMHGHPGHTSFCPGAQKFLRRRRRRGVSATRVGIWRARSERGPALEDMSAVVRDLSRRRLLHSMFVRARFRGALGNRRRPDTSRGHAVNLSRGAAAAWKAFSKKRTPWCPQSRAPGARNRNTTALAA